MTRAAQLPAIAWAVLAFTALRSTELINAWRHSPLDRFGWIAFLVWLSPIAASVTKPSAPGFHAVRPWLLGASLGASLIGIVADLNTANYLGLALAVAALGGWSWQHALWFASAIAWMPAFSWAGQGLPRTAIIAGRIVATSLASFPLLWSLISPKPRHATP